MTVLFIFILLCLIAFSGYFVGHYFGHQSGIEFEKYEQEIKRLEKEMAKGCDQ